MTTTLPALWSTDPEDIAAHRLDRSGWDPGHQPVAVAHPRSVDEVAEVLRDASASGTPVVIRGAGTGLSGGAVAIEGSVILDLKGLDAIEHISVADQQAFVQPGVLTAELDRAAGRHGLRYAPDPASLEISSIGGNIATNAGGLRCAKYGVTRDAVLGLDVLLADGRLIKTGRRTIKGVAGYDLTSLFVGSEGTLGVIVGAALRLQPIPPATSTIAAYFDDLDGATHALARVLGTGLQPSLAELLSGPLLAVIDAHLGSAPARAGSRPADTGSAPVHAGGALLLLQTDGYGAHLESAAAQAVLADLASAVIATDDANEAAGLIATRRAALPALERLGQVLIEDIAVPRSRLAEAIAAIERISTRSGVSIYTFAHAADGNIHPIIVADPARGLDEQVVAAADEIFALALELGGTVTGEHGIGVLKKHWLARELGPENLALQQNIKAAFDPANILNPGRAI